MKCQPRELQANKYCHVPPVVSRLQMQAAALFLLPFLSSSCASLSTLHPSITPFNNQRRIHLLPFEHLLFLTSLFTLFSPTVNMSRDRIFVPETIEGLTGESAAFIRRLARRHRETSAQDWSDEDDQELITYANNREYTDVSGNAQKANVGSSHGLYRVLQQNGPQYISRAAMLFLETMYGPQPGRGINGLQRLQQQFGWAAPHRSGMSAARQDHRPSTPRQAGHRLPSVPRLGQNLDSKQPREDEGERGGKRSRGRPPHHDMPRRQSHNQRPRHPRQHPRQHPQRLQCPRSAPSAPSAPGGGHRRRPSKYLHRQLRNQAPLDTDSLPAGILDHYFATRELRAHGGGKLDGTTDQNPCPTDAFPIDTSNK